MIFKQEDRPIRRRRPAGPFAVAAALVAIISIGRIAQAASNIGEAAPSLVVQQLNGQTFDLNAARGKVVVINFWATWCPPCRQEMPALNAFCTSYHAEGLEMLGLSADRPHDRSDVIKAMQAFSYPAAMLDEAKVGGFGGPSSLPVSFVVDRDG